MEFIQKVFVQEAKEKNKERDGKTQTKQTSLNQSNQKSRETPKPFDRRGHRAFTEACWLKP